LPSESQSVRRGLALQTQMLIGFLIGLTAGLIAFASAPGAEWVVWLTTYVTGPIGQIFLRLLFMLVIPLLFSALVIGITEMGELAALKRVGIKTILYTVIVSAIAVVISLLAVNLLQPGRGVDPAQAQAMLESGKAGAQAIVAGGADKPTGVAAFLAIIPTNIFTAAADNDILALMFFALVFGTGMVIAESGPNPAAVARLKSVIEGIFDVTMRLIGVVIRLAPFAIACFMFNLAALFGWELLVRLSAYVGVVLIALGVQMFVIYPLILRFFAGRSPLAFFRESQEAMVMAFATASSNATLPTALRVAETKLRLPPKIARFILTIGATANQNGTAMFEGVTVLFLAQFFGIELSLTQQAMVMLVCIMGGIGTAGVPAGSLPVVALILGMVGVPPEGIGLVLGVDRFLDMCRTTLNVTGDLVCATVVSHGETAPEPVVTAAPEPAE
jgi:DAACS family dicarboxylate/amino acid:cation (Na+ or H+) symporter